MKPHKHAALIHAWADGAEIEWNGRDKVMEITKENLAVAAVDARLEKVGLPTYTELRAALNELSIYVLHNAHEDAVKLSAERAIRLVSGE